ncbi:hypothetical protein ACHAW5_006892 [Stephanodiscus triporus]|uniref:Uncharacterized protein n=1 Tax=Stephanodiscus triporus TaxID=2934178 RepID=A0ABD3MWI6_9STRA
MAEAEWSRRVMSLAADNIVRTPPGVWPSAQRRIMR